MQSWHVPRNHIASLALPRGAPSVRVANDQDVKAFFFPVRGVGPSNRGLLARSFVLHIATLPHGSRYADRASIQLSHRCSERRLESGPGLVFRSERTALASVTSAEGRG